MLRSLKIDHNDSELVTSAPFRSDQNTLNPITSNALIFYNQSTIRFFVLSADALEQESGRDRIEILVTMLDFMDFFAMSGLLYIENGSRLSPTQIGYRIDKICGKRTFALRTTGMWKLTPINATKSGMDLNLLKYNMQQDGHKFFMQNSALMKYLRKKCSPLGLHSQQGIDYKRYERNEKCRLDSIRDKYKQSATSRLFLIRTKEKIPFVCSHVWLHFPQFLPKEWFCSEGLPPSGEDNVLKQVQKLTSIMM
jgi:hypothetical protein